jgi:hypothetical protein
MSNSDNRAKAGIKSLDDIIYLGSKGGRDMANYIGAGAVAGYDKKKQLDTLRNKIQTTQPSAVTNPVTTDPDQELARKIRDGVISGSAASGAINTLKSGSQPTNTASPTYGQLPASYNSKYSGDVSSLVDKILNYQPFNYDYNTDPSYQAYKEQYTKAGDKAYQDTVGDLTALTGGRLNSWATSAASQAKNGYMEDLSNVIPTLENNAYSKYLGGIDSLRNNLSTLQTADNADYSKYRDTVGDYQNNRTYDRGVLESDRNFNEGVKEYNNTSAENKRQFDTTASENKREYDQTYKYNQGRAARSDLENDRTYNYQVTRDKVLDSQWLKKFNQEERQQILQNAIDQRQISVSEANSALNASEFKYNKSQDTKNEQTTKVNGYKSKIDNLLSATVDSYDEDKQKISKPRYSDSYIKDYVMNLNLDPALTAELLNYAGASK